MYWNPREAQWKGTGSGSFYDISHAKSQMRKLAEMCDYSCNFRVMPKAEVLTSDEIEAISQEEESW